VLDRAVMFIHTAADPVVECLLVPDLCLAVGEQFALQGKRVLVLLTDMTAFGDALKEIAIVMEQIPSNRGYPGDLYTQLAKRYEKAVDFEGAGSLTVLACVTMPGDDVTHPVPDNTGYITEGQLLSAQRADRAVRLAFAAQAAGQRQDPRRPPGHHGLLHPVVRPAARAARSATWASRCPPGTASCSSTANCSRIASWTCP
jgi:hypothetical protein